MSDFDDLISANRAFAAAFDKPGMPGAAAAGVAVVTCMDSRIDPLALLGLEVGDAKVIRNPGGRVTPQAMEALVLAVNLLGADRVMVIPHTSCAVASNTTAALRARVAESAGVDASWQEINVVTDQTGTLRDDVATVRSHPLVPATVTVGGFMYDVDTGLLTQLV